MAWKYSLNPIAIGRRRRVIATALVYGLSLSVRFTSATGEEVEIPPAAARGAYTATSMMANDGAQFSYSHWSLRPVQPLALRQGSPVPITSTPSCAANP